MLFFFVIFVSIQQLAGAPVPHPLSHIPSSDSLSLDRRAEVIECSDSGSRTIWNIVWSCAVTIFACTCVAVHPNIPSPNDSGWSIFKRGLSTMIYALIAPELMVTWALHQYLSAREIARKYNTEILQYHPLKYSRYRRLIKYVREWFCGGKATGPTTIMKWTKTHGFFIQMGGLMLHEAGEPIEVLTYPRLKALIQDEKIDIPRITERTINDKSKGDYLSKAFAVLQTTWFIAQCGARWAGKLPLAELEVVTLAFAVLNAITYALWLNKPQNVQEAIRIDLKTDLDISDDSKSEKSGCESWATALSRVSTPPVKAIRTTQHGWLHRHLLKDYRKYRVSRLGFCWFFVYRVPYRIVTSSLHPMKKLLVHTDSQDSCTVSLRVPMFSKAKLDNPDPVLVHYLPCLVGALFGSVHVIAWSSSSTEPERSLWRYSTMVIIIEPFLFAIAKGVTSRKTKPGTNFCFLDVIRSILIFVIWLPFIVGLPAYVVARVILFTQALASFQHLPSAVYCDVNWAAIIPHL